MSRFLSFAALLRSAKLNRKAHRLFSAVGWNLLVFAAESMSGPTSIAPGSPPGR
jgi:hypothetical protein